jgi:hypothetical protein
MGRLGTTVARVTPKEEVAREERPARPLPAMWEVTARLSAVLRADRHRLPLGLRAGPASPPRYGAHREDLVADGEVLYNFGVLTKRYELVSRTAAQLAPGIVGVAVGLVMLLVDVPMPMPFAPVLVGFWFALGKMPFGAHRGTRVRAMVGPLLRYGTLRLGGKSHWEMPQTWLTVVVNPATTGRSVVPVSNERSDTSTTPQKGRARRSRRGVPEHLPPELGRLRWLATTVDGAEAGLLAERVGRRSLLTAVVSVSGGDRFVFSGPDEQAAQILQWGEVLKTMAADGPGLRRLQWVERATPQPSTVQEDWSATAMRDARAEERADYQSLQAAIGTAAIHHDVYLGAQVETEAAPGPDALSETTAEVAQLCEHLTSIGLRPKVLSRRAIAATLRQWADPTAPERVALWGEGSIPVSQAGPASRTVGYDTLRTDGYVHRVGQIAAWPRIDVGTEWMYPLLATALAGSVRTVSMHFEAVSTEEAFQEARDARTTGGMAQRKRDEKGIITTEEEERRVDEARSRERELTRGFRQHKVAGLVMVSSPEVQTAERAWRQAQRKAVECHLDLREMHARGHEAWAATLPLCRLRFFRGLL